MRAAAAAMRAGMAASVLVAACDARPTTPAESPREGATAAAPSGPPQAPGVDVASGPVDPSVAKPVPREGVYANLDPDDDEIVAPPDARPGCEAELARAGVSFRPSTLPVHVEGKSRITCGAPQVVVYLSGPGKIAYEPRPLLTCGMALALARLERIVQDEAQRVFGSPVASITQLGTYNCREMAAYPGWVSEHAYANAIDLSRFTLRNGTRISVLGDFDVGDGPPKHKAGEFLRSVSRRAFDEDVFSHVLTPFFDAHHRDHFHVDLARYRGDGTRPGTG